jgi:hypothetical protein
MKSAWTENLGSGHITDVMLHGSSVTGTYHYSIRSCGDGVSQCLNGAWTNDQGTSVMSSSLPIVSAAFSFLRLNSLYLLSYPLYAGLSSIFVFYITLFLYFCLYRFIFSFIFRPCHLMF